MNVPVDHTMNNEDIYIIIPNCIWILCNPLIVLGYERRWIELQYIELGVSELELLLSGNAAITMVKR